MAPITNGAVKSVSDHVPAGASDAGDDSKTLWNRYEYARFGDNVKNELIEDILTRYDQLVKTHQEYVATYGNGYGHEASLCPTKREEALQSSIDHLQRLLNAEPFVLVLIDGDGMIFHQNLINKGLEGGQLAANAIQNAVHSWARTNIPETPEEVKVVVRVYANVVVIADACMKAGIISHRDQMQDFVLGFTSANPLFDFIDVGFRKDAVEEKAVGQLKLFLYNYYCRHVLFGGSHNEGYAGMLQQYMSDNQAKARITLLEAAPFGEELSALPLPHVTIPGVFRNAKLIMPPHKDFYTNVRERVDSNNSLNAASSVFTPRTNTPSNVLSPYGSVSSLDQLSMAGSRRARVDSVDVSSDAGGGTWATVTRKNAHRAVEDMVQAPVRGVQPSIHRNKHGQRVDASMEYDRKEVQRIKVLKACNQYYIGVGCCHFNAGKADKCPHNHHYTFTSAELNTLRIVARETPCKKGHECDDTKCIYGHQCPFPVASEGSLRGGRHCMNGEACRFPATMHGMDTVKLKITKITGI